MQWRVIEERARLVRRFEEWLPRVAEAIKALWPDSEVYLVGSLARGDYTGASDVDILIVTSSPPRGPRQEAEAKVRIEEAAGVEDYSLLDLHFVEPSEKERTLRRFETYRRLA